MIENLNNETIAEQARKPTELTENELAHISGGTDDGTNGTDWCGTKPPGSHPGGVHRS